MNAGVRCPLPPSPAPGDPGLAGVPLDPPGLQVPACSAAGAVTSDAALSLGRSYPDVGPFPSPEGKNGGAAAGRAGARRVSSAAICPRVAALGSRARPAVIGDTVVRLVGRYGAGVEREAKPPPARPGRGWLCRPGRSLPGRAGAQLRSGNRTRRG